MQNSLAKMTEKQLLEWYKTTLLSNAKQNGLTVEPQSHTKQSRLNHDIWNLYDYGDVVKIVYIKNCPKSPDPRKIDPLFPELQKPRPKIEKHPRPENERFSNSVSRSRSRVFELAMCNEFTHFCTFTQDEKLRDRFDLSEFRKDLAQLVRNINRGRDTKIKYLLIPEQHKNGAWHIHGLLLGLSDSDLKEFTLEEKLPEKLRKRIAKGEKIYDWKRYRQAFGYFTCTEIGNQVACAKYITKYISKDMQKNLLETGQHLFFASQGLKGRETVVKNCADPCPIADWDYENEYVKIVEVPKNGVTLFKQVSHKTDTKKYTSEKLS